MLMITNRSNVWKSKVFHIYRHGKNSGSKVSFLTRSSVKRLVPSRKIEIRRKTRIFTLIVRARQSSIRLDGSTRKFFINNAVIIKRNSNLTNNRVKGPAILELFRKKHLSFFSDLH